MKCLAVKTSFFLLIALPVISFAGWQVAKPGAAIPSEPFFQAGTQQNTAFVPSNGSNAFPNRFATLGRPAAIYAISLSGSLKENLERIMDRYHWKVLWKVPYDYNFDGRVTGSSLPDVIEKILQPFPLQARMYMSNRTMTVVPRKP
jgi:hypothetical protein